VKYEEYPLKKHTFQSITENLSEISVLLQKQLNIKLKNGTITTSWHFGAAHPRIKALTCRG